jgi:hypothetical protein
VTAEIILRFMHVLFSFNTANKQSVNTTQDIPTVNNISSPYNTRCGDGLFIASIDSCNTWHSPVRQSQASEVSQVDIYVAEVYMSHCTKAICGLTNGTFKTGHYTADGHQRPPRHIPLTVRNDDGNDDDPKHRYQYSKTDTSYSGCRLEEHLPSLKLFVGLLCVSRQMLGWYLRPTICSRCCDLSKIYSPANDSVLSIPAACNRAASVT